MDEEFKKALDKRLDVFFVIPSDAVAAKKFARWGYNWCLERGKESKFGTLWAEKYYDKVEELNAAVDVIEKLKAELALKKVDPNV